MGAPINHAGPESHITYDLLPADCFQARMLLCDTMLEVGFANLATEWWHFSYGDQIWAYFYGEESTLY
jgi:D-alanyl-D-alanine dipeptidase